MYHCAKIDLLIYLVKTMSGQIPTLSGYLKDLQARYNKENVEIKTKHLPTKKYPTLKDFLKGTINKISHEEFKELCENYRGQLHRSCASIFVQTSSEATRSLMEINKSKSGEERADKIIEYMCEKENFKLGFCKYLWDYYLLKIEKMMIKNNEEEKEEKEEKENQIPNNNFC